MRISRIHRLLSLVTMLQSGRGYTANDLATELEVSRRTIFRDLNMLEMARIPYYFDPEKGAYQISRHFFLPPINLTLAEALAMLVLTGRLQPTRNLPLLSHGTKAAMKVESALPRPIREHVGSMIGRLSVSLGPVSRHEGLDATFDQLAEAIGARRICRIVYISFHERKQIVTNVHPLRLAFISRGWYLVGHSTKHREVRTFKLSRIRKLAVTDRTFVAPKDVDLQDYLGGAWGMIPEGRVYNVHLRFAPKVAGNVAEVQWHETQRVEWNEDGSAEFRVRVDGLGEITWWILGYGDQVEVISPRTLRARIAKIAAAVAETHGKGGK